jgi:spoIIIJ-associated protein
MIEKNVSEDEAGMLMIDINGYNKKRFDSLKNTAHMLAERARYFKNSVELEPMPAYERRIVHMFLENIPDIVTESAGVGPGRRVVIKYKEKEEI